MKIRRVATEEITSLSQRPRSNPDQLQFSETERVHAARQMGATGTCSRMPDRPRLTRHCGQRSAMRSFLTADDGFFGRPPNEGFRWAYVARQNRGEVQVSTRDDCDREGFTGCCSRDLSGSGLPIEAEIGVPAHAGVRAPGPVAAVSSRSGLGQPARDARTGPNPPDPAKQVHRPVVVCTPRVFDCEGNTIRQRPIRGPARYPSADHPVNTGGHRPESWARCRHIHVACGPTWGKRRNVLVTLLVGPVDDGAGAP